MSPWVQCPVTAHPLRVPSPKKACCITRRAPPTWAKNTGRLASWSSGGGSHSSGPGLHLGLLGPQQGSPLGRPLGREAHGGLFPPPQGFWSRPPPGCESFCVKRPSPGPKDPGAHQVGVRAGLLPRFSPSPGLLRGQHALLSLCSSLFTFPSTEGRPLGLWGLRPQLQAPPGIWAPPGLRFSGRASPLPCCAPAATGSSTSIPTAQMSPLCSL